MEPEAGRKVGGRYRLEEPIDAGGMAIVWRALDEVLHRDVAFKMLRSELAHDEDLVERFRVEAVASARLSHPAIVRTFDTGIDGDVCYIVLELFSGPSAADVLERDGPLPPERAVAIVRAALAGLGHAHGAGVVHRDVKPSNILIGDDGLVKVTDFGIAKAAFAGGDLTTTGNLLGTAKYLAPEQVEGKGSDARSDLYSAGVMLYELLTGRAPFEAETHLATATMRLTEDPAPPSALRPGIRPELDAAVLRALERDPERRFQSADEMIAGLNRAVLAPEDAGSTVRLPVDAGSTVRLPVAERPRRIRAWTPILVAVALVAALGIGSFFLVRALLDGDGGGGGSRQPNASPRAVAIIDAFAHDPPPGDGEEHDEEAPNAADGNPQTFWQTSTYEQHDLGGLKPGVGLVLELREPAEIARLELTTTNPGWTFEVQGSEDGVGYSGPLASVDGETAFTADRATGVELAPADAFRYWMVWITDLAPAPSGGFGATVADVELFQDG